MNSWAVKISLFLNYFVFAILLNSVGTVILQVQNSYGVSESSAGVLEAFKDLSIALTSFLVASFLARFGFKRAMLLSLAFVGIACLAMPNIPTFWMAKVLFSVVGVGFALVKVSVFSCIGLVSGNRREHASLMSFLESFFMVGILSGYFIFSSFVDDSSPESLQWLNVYYLLAVLCFIAFAILGMTTVDESDGCPDADNKFGFIDMLQLCLRPLVYLFVICAFLYVLIEQSIMSWLPTFNNSVLNLSTSLSIQMTSILAGATALGRFVAGFLLRRFDWFLLLGVCLVSAGLLVILVLPMASLADGVSVNTWMAAPLAAFIFPLIGFCLAPVYPAINSVILSSLPKHQHAPMSGLIVVFSALGGTTGSIVTGTLFEVFDGRVAFYCSLIPISLILIALFFFKKESQKSGAAEVVIND